MNLLCGGVSLILLSLVLVACSGGGGDTDKESDPDHRNDQVVEPDGEDIEQRLREFASFGDDRRQEFTEDVLEHHPLIRDFEELFEDTRYQVMAPATDNPRWQSTAILHDRYVLKVTFSLAHHGPSVRYLGLGEGVEIAAPHIQLLEARSVQELDGDRLRISYNTRGERQLTLKEWLQLVDERGDFGAIGVDLQENQPVEGLKQAFERGAL